MTSLASLNAKEVFVGSKLKTAGFPGWTSHL